MEGPEALARELAQLPQIATPVPVLVSSFVLAREWKDGGAAVVRTFADFWSRYEVRVGKPLLACLAVRYEERHWLTGFSWASRKAQRAVAALKRSHPDVLVLPVLEPVLQSEAEKWTVKSEVRDWRYVPSEALNKSRHPGCCGKRGSRRY